MGFAACRHLAGHVAAVEALALSKLGELQQAEAELTEVIIRLDPLVDDDAQLLLYARQWHYHVLVQLGWVSETEADARFIAERDARQLGARPPRHTALAGTVRCGAVGCRPPR